MLMEASQLGVVDALGRSTLECASATRRPLRDRAIWAFSQDWEPRQRIPVRQAPHGEDRLRLTPKLENRYRLRPGSPSARRSWHPGVSITIAGRFFFFIRVDDLAWTRGWRNDIESVPRKTVATPGTLAKCGGIGQAVPSPSRQINLGDIAGHDDQRLVPSW